MSNWLTLSFLYDFNPSLYNYINFKFYHFKFCSKDDSSITASIYLDNLAGEIKKDIAEQKSVNKKSLNIAFVKRILENKEARQQIILLFEKKQTAVNKVEIREFLNQVNFLLNPSSQSERIAQELTVQPEQVAQSKQNIQPEPIALPERSTGEEEQIVSDFPVRTYVIATHMYLELNNNELHYETLIRDTNALKKFITVKFKVNKIAGRIADMKSFSYKKILSGKNNGSATSQLKPQIEQIAVNPATFGKDVSAFAKNVLESISA